MHCKSIKYNILFITIVFFIFIIVLCLYVVSHKNTEITQTHVDRLWNYDNSYPPCIIAPLTSGKILVTDFDTSTNSTNTVSLSTDVFVNDIGVIDDKVVLLGGRSRLKNDDPSGLYEISIDSGKTKHRVIYEDGGREYDVAHPIQMFWNDQVRTLYLCTDNALIAVRYQNEKYTIKSVNHTIERASHWAWTRDNYFYYKGLSSIRRIDIVSGVDSVWEFQYPLMAKSDIAGKVVVGDNKFIYVITTDVSEYNVVNTKKLLKHKSDDIAHEMWTATCGPSDQLLLTQSREYFDKIVSNIYYQNKYVTLYNVMVGRVCAH